VKLFVGALLAVSAFAQKLDPAQCAAMKHHGDPNSRNCYQQLTRSSDPVVRAQGLWGLRQYMDANELLLAVAKSHEKDADFQVLRGRILIDVDQMDDASALFDRALEVKPDYPPALLGSARVAAAAFSGKAAILAENALKGDPKLYQARELLARIALEDNNEKKAAEEAEKALAISPEALEAMSILATIDWLHDKQTTPWLEKIQKINPVYGEVYETAGHFFDINRRYDEASRSFRKAFEVNPSLDSARAELGINRMRFGFDDEARKLLEEAYNNGYHNSATRNTLKLLDTYKNYVMRKTPTTILRLQKKEADLVGPYFEAELQRAIATYEKKYKFKLNAPVQVEVYPNHEDFAVRTMGMPGLGALGVTFGNVVAMDSPNGRPPGQFHWATTLWHELSHVYVISMTKSRVPRWFTEGLAVFEETASSPDWGDRLDPEAINAIKNKKLLPIAELDRGFIHPTYPTQVVVSYFQGGRICQFINEKWGYQKLLDMIAEFAKLTPTPDTIEKVLGLKPEEFDKQFLAWIEARDKVTLEHFNDWKKRVSQVAAAAKAKDWDTAIREGTEIRDWYPEYVEAGSVYEALADAYVAKGEKAKAIAQLEAYSKIGGRHPATLKHLAEMQAEEGKKREAAETLERLNLIYLKDDVAHKRLGDLYTDLGNSKLAVREYQAMIASGTVDQAGAHFSLARALQSAGRIADAREEVLSALEAAPGFKPAQKLLLELNAKEKQ
jgi:tetratricopeptide (TPR) repeat protein